MTNTLGQRWLPALAMLTLLWLALFGPGLFHPPLFDDADGAHAEAGREILVRHDWVTLHENGFRYLEKAPLPYWGMALAFRLFGVAEWTARLTLHLSVLLLALLLYQFGRRFLTAQAGFWAGVAFLAACGPYLFTRILIPDITVGLWIGIALYFFLDGWQSEKPSLLSCWGLAAVIGLNVLTKGLIGIVFPCAILFVFLLLAGDLRHILRMRLFSSTLVFLLVAAPWHVLAALRNPPAGQAKGFLWFYFVNEHFLRYLGKRYPADYGTVPIVLFYGLILIWLLPWSSFLPQAFAEVRLRLPRIAGVRRSKEAVLLLLFCWAAVILLFFSFSTRQEYYVAPVLPPLALLLGHWLAREAEAPIGSSIARAGRISSTVLMAVGLLIAAITGGLAIVSHRPAAGVELADLLNKNSPDAYFLSLGHFLDLTGNAMSLFRGPLTGTALAFLFGTALNWFLRRRGRVLAANWALVAMMVAFIECAHIALGTFAPVLSSKPLAEAIEKQFQPGDAIVGDGDFSYTSSIAFYTGVQEYVLNGGATGLWYGSLFPDAPHVLLDDSSFAPMWTGTRRVFFVAASTDRRAFLEKLAPAYEVAHAGGKVVYSNQPGHARATALR
ncbi:MAG TPA: glycosyltransferase family 39 protein [Candidatus Acidoferrum sp.]